MANYSNNIGAHSQLVAKTALLANGYEIANPEAPEVYDIVARHPLSRDWQTFQVKTVRRRDDRGGALVVCGSRNSGEVYTRDDADYLIGVLDGEVYLIENRELSEYWATPDNINEKWRKLSTVIKKQLSEAV
ncbi:hypothetical protein C0R09_18830 [Brevibacillus laterosporus]|uniref:hypothetical protein n=1 Tax=Brevibacillus laterosporus TaxID=1465 RepID=UPI000C75E32E|nr:hypothetical protein [Brevibacillus laterosporus]AUM66410.1 hypothetical protein C0R09_18830 [Brevibacillus laterosporus]